MTIYHQPPFSEQTPLRVDPLQAMRGSELAQSQVAVPAEHRPWLKAILNPQLRPGMEGIESAMVSAGQPAGLTEPTANWRDVLPPPNAFDDREPTPMHHDPDVPFEPTLQQSGESPRPRFTVGALGGLSLSGLARVPGVQGGKVHRRLRPDAVEADDELTTSYDQQGEQ